MQKWILILNIWILMICKINQAQNKILELAKILSICYLKISNFIENI